MYKGAGNVKNSPENLRDSRSTICVESAAELYFKFSPKNWTNLTFSNVAVGAYSIMALMVSPHEIPTVLLPPLMSSLNFSAA